MIFTVETEEELGFFVLVDVDGGHEMGPLSLDVIKTSRVARSLVNQVELVAVSDTDLVVALATGRETGA